MNYLVIGDVINSRKNLLKAHKSLNSSVTKINKDFDLIYPMTITLGDEFQAVASSLEDAKKLVKDHKGLMKEIKLRYVIVPLYGDISLMTEVQKNCPHFNPLATCEMKYAQEKIKELKKTNKRLLIITSIKYATRQKYVGLDYQNKPSIKRFCRKTKDGRLVRFPKDEKREFRLKRSLKIV